MMTSASGKEQPTYLHNTLFGIGGTVPLLRAIATTRSDKSFALWASLSRPEQTPLILNSLKSQHASERPPRR